jgi:hypothetical protein
MFLICSSVSSALCSGAVAASADLVLDFPPDCR